MSPIILLLSTAMVAVGIGFAFARLERGPGMLNRVVAMDVITAAIIAILATVSAVTDRWDLIPVFVVLALIGFIGSVSVARFAAADRGEQDEGAAPSSPLYVDDEGSGE